MELIAPEMVGGAQNSSERAALERGQASSGVDNVVLWAVIDGFLCLAIVTGNVLTVGAILKSTRLSRAVSNQFILSLALSDLLVGLVLPYHMAFYIEGSLNCNFDLCLARLALVSLACIASVLNIIGIAVDRFVAIVYPLHYGKYMTKRFARVFMAVAWAVAIAIATAPAYWHRRPKLKEPCQLGYVVDRKYVMVIYVPAFVLLLAVMCGFYLKIITEARKQVNRLSNSTQFKSEPPDTGKSTQVLMLVMGSFTISYTPFIILVILNSVSEVGETSTAYKIANSLAMANSAVNPLIYAWKNKEFKRTFCKILHCKAISGGSAEGLPELKATRVKSFHEPKIQEPK